MTGQKSLKEGISLCMIVKNEEESITRALESVYGLVDEIVVVDTGSEDRTVEYAQKLCAHVFTYDWNDDFAAARNFAIDQAGCKWILVLDADEIISRKDFTKVKQAVTQETVDAFVFLQRNYCESPDAEGWQANRGEYEESHGFSGFFDVPIIRLFRNEPEIRFKGVVHELVDEAVKKKQKRYLDIPIHHYTYFEKPAERDQKSEFYLSLLLKQLEREPENETTWFLVGRQYYTLGQYAEAIVFLKRVIEFGSKCEMAYDNLAMAYINSGMFEEARDTLEALLRVNPRYSEAFSGLGIAYYELGFTTKALETLKRASMEQPYAFRPFFNLAAICYRERNFSAALEAITKAEHVIPHFPRIYYLKFFILFELKMWDAAHACADKLRMLDLVLYESIESKHQEIISSHNVRKGAVQ